MIRNTRVDRDPVPPSVCVGAIRNVSQGPSKASGPFQVKKWTNVHVRELRGQLCQAGSGAPRSPARSLPPPSHTTCASSFGSSRVPIATAVTLPRLLAHRASLEPRGLWSHTP